MSVIMTSLKAVDTSDGENVKLKRVFGYHQKEMFDPFLLLDHIDTDEVQQGFPWHPHRGIETITYLIKGGAKHQDSLGNEGTLKGGDVQWMLTGSGILHQEFPDDNYKEIELLQFWLNMPAANKMDDPQYYYTNIFEDNVVSVGSSTVSVIAGNYKDTKGPIQKQSRNIRMLYLDIQKDNLIDINRVEGTNGFLYVLSGEGTVNEESIEKHTIYKLSESSFELKATSPLKAIFAEGNPLHENIEWYGPIVMNTKEEIRQARVELNNGTFIKNKGGNIK